MKNWFNSLRERFEKKPERKKLNEIANEISKNTKFGLVHERTKAYESLNNRSASTKPKSIPGGAKPTILVPKNNIKPPVKPKPTPRKKYLASKEDLSNEEIKPSTSQSPPILPSKPYNFDRTPSKIVNKDNVCIYTTQESDELFGSFTKRPKFSSEFNQNRYSKEENGEDVLKRLKEKEVEFKSITRYDSILKSAPLMQQTIIKQVTRTMQREQQQQQQQKPSVPPTANDNINVINRNNDDGNALKNQRNYSSDIFVSSNLLHKNTYSVNELIEAFDRRSNGNVDQDNSHYLDCKLLKTLVRSSVTEEYISMNNNNAEINSNKCNSNVKVGGGGGGRADVCHKPPILPPNLINRRVSCTTCSVVDMLGQSKTLRWIEMDQVKKKCNTNTMSSEQISLYETQFELISTEASYYRSLTVLIETFYNAPQMAVVNQDTSGSTDDLEEKKDVVNYILKPYQKDHLFSNILKIYAVSSRFLQKLEEVFSRDVYMKGICKVVIEFCREQFSVYIPYLQNQKFQTETYNELKKDSRACQVIEELEASPSCCSLSLDSFLLLPMQRPLRIKLLLENILKYAERSGNNDNINQTKEAISAIEEVIQKCSNQKDQMDERQRMLEWCSRLVFKPGLATPTLSTGCLMRENYFRRSRKEYQGVSKKWTDSFRTNFQDMLFILTNQYLLMVKVLNPHRNPSYQVDDYCLLSDITVKDIGHISSLPSDPEIKECLAEDINSEEPIGPPRVKLTIAKSTDNNNNNNNNSNSNNEYSYTVQAKTWQDLNDWISKINECNEKQLHQ